MAEENSILTLEGKQKLEAELEHLVHVVRPEVIEEIKLARSQGDLSENADYDAARARQADVESEIQKIEHMLNSYIVLSEEGNATVVKAGSTVVLFDEHTKKESTYQIKGSVEADPINNIISNLSPLAQSIIGHGKGEVVVVNNIRKPYSVKIIDIK